MKKILYTIAVCFLALVSCEKLDSLLDTKNYSKADTSSFPRTEKDAEQLVNSAYSTMHSLYTGSIFKINLFRRMIASDDIYGAGSKSSKETTADDRLLAPSSDEDNSVWKSFYNGLFRCNFALESISEMDDNLFTGDNKTWYLGQVHFMRAFYLWEMAERWETFPLTLSTQVENMPKASVDDIYAAIAADLKDAISMIPAKYGYSKDNNLAGRATKYAAEALMGRVWLFYTGFYKKADMAGVTKSQVISWLEDCANTNVSKFDLEKDQRELWMYSNEYSSGFAYGVDFGTWAHKENLHWVGNHSKETVWGVHFSYTGSGYNRLAEWLGFRNSSQTPNAQSYPYSAGGNGNASVNPLFVKEWYEDKDYGPTDKRFYGTILVTNKSKIAIAYPWYKGDIELPDFKGHDSKEIERTWFYTKKYQAMAAYSDGAKTTLKKNFFNLVNGAIDNNAKRGNKNDAIYIRFADVLLMLDELKETTTGMNRLRERAGLKPYDSYTFERLQKERRYEFATEGMRFNDLRRWYPETAGQIIEKNQDGGYLEYLGKPNTYKELEGRSFSQRYALTRGFWMIPQEQINLQQGVLEQNEGFKDGQSYLFVDGDLPY
ncbi:MAG: RagB/SusD family nutrient uptake outer membrane protein [Bacteroidales bacterium]|nr:RagB/SusD family nutrient uptake outer membrane protein [Bacteroidales bacterium]